MNQLHIPKLAYTFASQQAANQFLNAYSNSGTAYETAITPQPVSGMKGSTVGLICLLLVAGLVMVYVYHANKENSKDDEQGPR